MDSPTPEAHAQPLTAGTSPRYSMPCSDSPCLSTAGGPSSVAAPHAPGSSVRPPLQRPPEFASLASPPLTPSVLCDNLLQIVQTNDTVVTFSEWIHDVRVVRLDGRSRVPGLSDGCSSVWVGHSPRRCRGAAAAVDVEPSLKRRVRNRRTAGVRARDATTPPLLRRRTASAAGLARRLPIPRFAPLRDAREPGP